MTGHRWRLRAQLSLAMIFTALTALGVFMIGMIAFYLLLQDIWLSSLSSENQATLQSLIDDETVSPDALTTLVGAFSGYWGQGKYAYAELLALCLLVALAVVSAILVGILVARRLSAPIETVTDAALEIAGGNLAHEMPKISGGAAETQDLLTAFGTMTQNLAEAEREATESSAAIAHELRTPLTILRGRLQGLGDGAFAPSREMTDGLIGQVDTLSRIVDELSLISKLSAGRFEPQIIPVDLATEVERVVTTMRPDLERQGMAVNTALQSVQLKADPVLIRQAVAAVIHNAGRYAAEGGQLLVKSTVSGDFALIEVADNGPGIPASDRKKVFERWWRGDRSRNRSEGGTGLGLSIVKAIAKAHGGDAYAHANLPKGAVLTIQLPLNAG